MQVALESALKTTPVPRGTFAPWLDPRRRKHRLIKNFAIEVDGVRYVVPCSYVTDFLSIPTPFNWIWSRDEERGRPAAVPHDYFYSHMYDKVSKEWADRVFYEILLLQGYPETRACIYYNAVKYGGKGGW